MFVDPPLLDAALRGIILSLAGLAWTLMLVRALGLRSFSKMTGLDFAMTIATGSLLAGASQAEDLAGLLDATRVTRSDLMAKLREANVLRFDAVRAVVLETTGDISVMHGDHLEQELVDGVRG